MMKYGLKEVATMINEDEIINEEVLQEVSEEPVEEAKIERPISVAPDNLEAIIEGLLYVVGDEGVKVDQLVSVTKASKEDVEVALNNIQTKYCESIYGIELVGYGSNYKFVSKKEIYPYIQELFHVQKNNTLSQSALETLAIIAYKQPITRIEIEELRGVGAEMMLRKLLARNLIKEAGRSDSPGKPILYEVTEEFMDSFKLYTLNELPDLPSFENKDDETKDLFD